uniref:Uncharacterized protein n=1 Tax=Rhizophagus irregularis (strain DAOM 181602 / DAOM 197198 / MUCL 43194) TaxID=747089 RepID=U9URL3_RHIID
MEGSGYLFRPPSFKSPASSAISRLICISLGGLTTMVSFWEFRNSENGGSILWISFARSISATGSLDLRFGMFLIS